MDPDLRTTALHAIIERFRAGDRTGLDELIRRTQDHFERIARRMLRDFPIVRVHEQAEDVVQSALLRLVRALREVTPASAREFFGLAAGQIRRELIDLARRHRRRPAEPLGERDLAQPESSDLEDWAALQEAVEALPAELREVFSLAFYHGWAQPEIAALLQVSERQVRRLWARACLHVNRAVHGNLPAP